MPSRESTVSPDGYASGMEGRWGGWAGNIWPRGESAPREESCAAEEEAVAWGWGERSPPPPRITERSHPCAQGTPSPGALVGGTHVSSWALQWAALVTPLPAPASASLHASLPRAPSCLLFLPLPTLNRLRQQDGTNLWLNSPKITRDLSKAVCVKLAGACTLLSNALSSEAGQGTPLPLTSVWCHPGSILLCLRLAPLKDVPKSVKPTSFPAPVPGRGSLPVHRPANLALCLCQPILHSRVWHGGRCGGGPRSW